MNNCAITDGNRQANSDFVSDMSLVPSLWFAGEPVKLFTSISCANKAVIVIVIVIVIVEIFARADPLVSLKVP